jgi:lysophospholipase L1-like esterase
MKRKLLICAWTLLWVAAAAVAAELLSRRLLVPWHQEIGNRHMQPYFMTGGYFQTPTPGVRPENLITGPSGPEAYGYSKQGDIYVYRFEDEISSIAERGSFLFQDRVDLANDIENEDVLRIFVIGGSAAYGVGASSKDKRWYAVLERSLSASISRTVRLIPAAMIGYGSTQERLVLDLMVLPRRPDAIVILNGFNDAALPALFGSRPGDPYDQGVLYADFYSPFFGLKKWVAKYSQLFRYLMHRSLGQTLETNRQNMLTNPRALQTYAKSTAAVYFDNVRHMLRRCRDQGVSCKVFLQPARDLTWRTRGIEKSLDPFTLVAYDHIRQQITDIAPEESIVDLTSVFDGPGREEWYRDTVHFKDLGHEAIAEAMHPIMIDMLREARNSPRKRNSVRRS